MRIFDYTGLPTQDKTVKTTQNSNNIWSLMFGFCIQLIKNRNKPVLAYTRNPGLKTKQILYNRLWNLLVTLYDMQRKLNKGQTHATLRPHRSSCFDFTPSMTWANFSGLKHFSLPNTFSKIDMIKINFNLPSNLL